MCGIAGIINKVESLPIVPALITMTNSLVNRGPDDEGYMLYNEKTELFSGFDSIVKNYPHINNSINKKIKIGFGFRQLKIIDLSNNSHQPMCDINCNYWIIFNGEIYNFKEIKNELIHLGYSFFSNSDTEVILKAYIEWSEKAIDKFNGMFAFSIFDKIKNEIFIARDRLGIKPLYYHQSSKHFIFASTQKAIIDSNLYNPEIDWEGMALNFRFSIAQRPKTCFKNISALEPASYLKINLTNSTIYKKQYWEIPVNNQDFSLTEKQSTELIEENLFKSVQYRLNADVEVGTFMSGGIDSTTVASIASKLNPNIKALTLGFKNFKNYDEIDQAKDTAYLNKINHIISYTKPSDVIHNIQKITIAYEEPYYHLSANFILAQMASQNKLKVVLSGLGGDELFGGYEIYNKIDLWKNLKYFKQFINLIPEFNQKVKKVKQLANYNTIGEYYSHFYSNYSDYEINKLFNNSVYNSKYTLSNLYNSKNLKFTDEIEAISFFNLKSYISNHQMRAVDQSTMSFSIEGRFPLLDHNFIETAFKIPSKYKIRNNSQKFILKQVAKKHISKSCLSMNKKGLSLPLKYWINNSFKEFVFDSIVTLKNRNIFNNDEIDIVMNSNNENKIWQLVSTELWINQFISKNE